MLYYKHMRYLDVAKNIKRSILFLAAAVFIASAFTALLSQTAQAVTYVEPSQISCMSGWEKKGNKDTGYYCKNGASKMTPSLGCPSGSRAVDTESVSTRCEAENDSSDNNSGSSGSSGSSSSAPDVKCASGFFAVQGPAGGWYCRNENNDKMVRPIDSMTCPDGYEQKETEDSSVNTTTYSCVSPDEEEKSCSSEVDQVGWWICPLLHTAMNVADSFWALFENLLVMNPLKTDSSNSSFKTWGNFRDLANMLLAVIFLAVIFSQISNIGISNYGIKKMLPRLILAAVLVNISYFVMQIVIDVANILGANLMKIVTDNTSTDMSNISWTSLIDDIFKVGLTVTAVSTAAVAGISVVSVGPILIFVLMLLIPALIGFIAGLLAIVFRTGIIPVLAALSPVAIVAWVLPNTQSLFDKWRKIFASMVFLYPTAALYYGGLKFVAMSMITNEDSGTFERLMGFVMLYLGTFVVFIMALKGK